MAVAVTINNLPINRVRYLDWLVTGLGQLQQQGVCRLGFDLSWSDWLSRRKATRHPFKYLCKNRFLTAEDECWWAEATVTDRGKSVRFAFDIRDEPWQFGVAALETCQLYFKSQMPCEFAPEGFPLSSRITAQYDFDLNAHRNKIRPAMLGRPLGQSLDWKENLEILTKLEALAETPQQTAIFAYFGTDKMASKVRGEVTRLPNKEEDPNLKRFEAVARLKKRFGDRVDAGLVDSADPTLKRQAIPDLAEFMRHVARASWNLNISGIGLSIPFRFIDSFLLGTAILTDDLKLCWKRPFHEAEVRQFGAFGYEPFDSCPWDKFEAAADACMAESESARIDRRAAVLDSYRRDWSPSALARYVLDECGKIM